MLAPAAPAPASGGDSCIRETRARRARARWVRQYNRLPPRAASQVEADFLEQPVLPIRIPGGSLARLRAAEDRYLNTAVIVYPFDPPFVLIMPER
jgi:hypothetical protein